MTEKERIQEVRCQQILRPDGSVYSVQWMELAEADRTLLAPSRLLERYYRFIRTCTGSLIRPVTTDAGVQFRLFPLGLPLLSFLPPQYRVFPEGEEVDLRISGGVLLQRGECDRGRFSLRIERVAAKLRVTVQLSDYCPLLLGSATPSRWRRLFYRLTQSYVHKVVTIRFLAQIYRELTGVRPKVRVEKVRLREGEEI